MAINADRIQALLPQSENGRLDFKRDMYELFHPKQEVINWHKAKLVRDILALANGNTHTVGETAYLVIGAADELNAQGSRDLFDVGEFDLSPKQILEWVNAIADPRLEWLDAKLVEYAGKRLFVIEIPPSRHVHTISTELQTGKNKGYTVHTVFMRIGENNMPASPQEKQALHKAKQQYFSHSKHTNPIWFGAIVGAIALGLIPNWSMILEFVPSGQFLTKQLGQGNALLLLRVVLGLIGVLIGGSLVLSQQRFDGYSKNTVLNLYDI